MTLVSSQKSKMGAEGSSLSHFGPSPTQEDQPSGGLRECGAPLSYAATVPMPSAAMKHPMSLAIPQA